MAILRTRPSASRPALSTLLRDWWDARRRRPATRLSPVSLPKGGLRRVVVAPGAAFACEGGTLWVTDARGWEAVLEAGESRVFRQENDLLVEALAPAVFSVKAGAVPP